MRTFHTYPVKSGDSKDTWLNWVITLLLLLRMLPSNWFDWCLCYL